MGDLRQILAWNTEPVRHIEEADCDDDVAGAVLAPVGDDGELRLRAENLEDTLVQPDVERLSRGDPAVVLDRFFTCRLVALHGEWMSANLDELGRGEELHPGGVADDGVDEGALVEDERGEVMAPGLDGAREPDRSGADDDDVVHVTTVDGNPFPFAVPGSTFVAVELNGQRSTVNG